MNRIRLLGGGFILTVMYFWLYWPNTKDAIPLLIPSLALIATVIYVRETTNIAKHNQSLVKATIDLVSQSEKSFLYNMKPKITPILISAGTWASTRYPGTMSLALKNLGQGIAVGLSLTITNQEISYKCLTKQTVFMRDDLHSSLFECAQIDKDGTLTDERQVKPCLLVITYRDEIGHLYNSRVTVKFNFNPANGSKNVEMDNDLLIGVNGEYPS